MARGNGECRVEPDAQLPEPRERRRLRQQPPDLLEAGLRADIGDSATSEVELHHSGGVLAHPEHRDDHGPGDRLLDRRHPQRASGQLDLLVDPERLPCDRRLRSVAVLQTDRAIADPEPQVGSGRGGYPDLSTPQQLGRPGETVPERAFIRIECGEVQAVEVGRHLDRQAVGSGRDAGPMEVDRPALARIEPLPEQRCLRSRNGGFRRERKVQVNSRPPELTREVDPRTESHHGHLDAGFLQRGTDRSDQSGHRDAVGSEDRAFAGGRLEGRHDTRRHHGVGEVGSGLLSRRSPRHDHRGQQRQPQAA